MKNYIAALTLLVITLAPNVVKAAPDCIPLPAWYAQANPKPVLNKVIKIFNQNMRGDCYGESRDTVEWVKDFNRLVNQPLPQDLIRTTRSGVKFLTDFLNDSPALLKKRQLRTSLTEWHAALYVEDIKVIRDAINFDNWQYFPNDYIFGEFDQPLMNLDLVIQQGCYTGTSPAACTAHLNNVEEFARFFNSMSHIADTFLEHKLAETVRGLSLLNSRWDAYFNDARPQNWVEVLVNAKYSNFRREKQCDNASVDKTECLLQLGGSFYAPPNSQIILLNPSIGLEYIADSPDGNQLQESLILEIAGFNRWKWSGDQMKSVFGASIIASYSDRQDTEDLGYGVMVHFGKNFSLGATKRSGGKEGFFINVELRDFLSNWSNSKKQKYSSYIDIVKNLKN